MTADSLEWFMYGVVWTLFALFLPTFFYRLGRGT